MKKKLALLMTAIVSTSALALAGCKTNIGWIDEKICKHEYEFVEITLEPTCTEEGERLMECVDCGKQKTETMEKIPHNEVVTPGKDPTCTEDGYTEKIVCNVCQEVLQEQVLIPVTAHTERVAIAGTPATCTEAGLTDKIVCEVCEAVLQEQEEIPVTAHKDENADDLCDSCGVISLPVAEVGEHVAGNTYRLYFPEENAQSWSTLKLSNDTGSYFNASVGRHETSYLWWSGSSGPVYYLEGLEVVKTDTYMEFNLQPGTYKILHSNGTDTGGTYVIDETTTIASCKGVYRVESDV